MARSSLGDGGAGGFFGGLAQGVSDYQQQKLEEEKQAALEANKTKVDAQKRITDTLDFIKEFSDNARAAGNDETKIAGAIKPFIDSLRGVAQGAGLDPDMVAHRALLTATTPSQQADSKKKIVTTSGGLGEPDRMHVFDERSGTLTPIDPSTGRPAAPTVAPTPAPAGQPPLSQSEVITPRQVQVANAPQVPPPAAPTEDASLPPNAQPTQGPFSTRFIEPAAPAPLQNNNVNYSAIEKFSPKAQALIKGVADGTIDPAKAFSKKIGKDGESELTKFLGAVKEYDPSFDTANAPARAATLKAFKSGVEARKLSALGTVVGHINELAKEGKALDNWKSDTFGPATKAVNAVRLMIQENKQSPAITRFDNTATAVSNELENAFRGNNTAISGIMEWRKGINAAMSSDQIEESTKNLGKLLLARMGELKEQWDRGMGHNQDPTIAIKLVKTRELLEKMAAGTLLSDRSATAPPPDAVKSLKEKYKLD